MRKAICHYSFHRTWQEQSWSADRLAEEVRKLGVEGIDFHTRLLGDRPEAAGEVLDAVARHGLTLSGLSFSNDFGREDPQESRAMIEQVKEWICLAAAVRAPVSRVFGGGIGLKEREDQTLYAAARQRILDSLGEVVGEAEKHGLVLALENHGGMPATGDEQAEIVQAIGSPSLRATIDVGNYMQVGCEGHEETAKAAPYAAYVHFKDFKKVPDETRPWGWGVQACTVGDGDVDLPACCQALTEAGYDGFVALEYEGTEDEMTGVRRSVDTMNAVLG